MPPIRPLKLGAPLSSSTLSGQTDLYVIQLRGTEPRGSSLTVRLRRKGGDPLLMVRRGPEPPSVPRRSKVIADAWDQQAFDTERAEHSVTVTIPPECREVHVGICNYSAHKRETCYYT